MAYKKVLISQSDEATLVCLQGFIEIGNLNLEIQYASTITSLLSSFKEWRPDIVITGNRFRGTNHAIDIAETAQRLIPNVRVYLYSLEPVLNARTLFSGVILKNGSVTPILRFLEGVSFQAA